VYVVSYVYELVLHDCCNYILVTVRVYVYSVIERLCIIVFKVHEYFPTSPSHILH